jgi:hypothetical protein
MYFVEPCRSYERLLRSHHGEYAKLLGPEGNDDGASACVELVTTGGLHFSVSSCRAACLDFFGSCNGWFCVGGGRGVRWWICVLGATSTGAAFGGLRLHGSRRRDFVRGPLRPQPVGAATEVKVEVVADERVLQPDAIRKASVSAKPLSSLRRLFPRCVRQIRLRVCVCVWGGGGCQGTRTYPLPATGTAPCSRPAARRPSEWVRNTKHRARMCAPKSKS